MTKDEKIEMLEKELAKLKKKPVDFSPLDKYLGKYLYFEGWESGSVICRIDEFGTLANEYGKELVVFRGLRIDLNTENCDFVGIGIHYFEEINKCCFPDNSFYMSFPYYENAYDFDDGDDSIEGQIKYLDAWLPYGCYADMETREISKNKVMGFITGHLDSYLPTEIGGDDEDKNGDE